jgi:predicted metalloprotease
LLVLSGPRSLALPLRRSQDREPRRREEGGFEIEACSGTTGGPFVRKVVVFVVAVLVIVGTLLLIVTIITLAASVSEVGEEGRRRQDKDGWNW